MTVDARGKPRSDYQTFFEDGSSLTVQSDAYLTDIQEILRNYGVHGVHAMLEQLDQQ